MLQQITSRRIVFFLVFLSIFTAGASIIASRMTGTPLASLLIMWTPALAATLTSIITKRPFKDMGWGVRPIKWLAIGWLIPIAYAALAYIPLWLTGLGHVPNPTFLERARLTLSLPTAPDLTVIIAAFGYITIVNLLPGMIMSLGEEIGWRGFLAPELAKSGSFRSAALISGVIWTVWHLPGILSGNYGASGAPLVFRVLCFATLVMSGAVIFAWLRIRSGSIWSTVIMHAVHNNVIQAFFDRITENTGYTQYFAGEFGIALAAVNLIIALLCWRQLLNRETLDTTKASMVVTLSRVSEIDPSQ